MSPKIVNVLVVEDSPVMRMLLTQLLRSDPRIRVLGTAEDGEAALAFLERNHPDVVLMDVNMPRLNGLEATRRIMATRPLPVVICSAVHRASEVSATFDALDAGAVAFLEKPPSPAHPEFGVKVREFLRTVIAMAGVNAPVPGAANGATLAANIPPLPAGMTAESIRVVAVGGSLGGPQALQAVLREWPRNLPVPVLVALSVAAGFLGVVVERLRTVTGLAVSVAEAGALAEPGRIYFAPEGMQMRVAADGRLALHRETAADGPPGNVVAPLLQSVAENFGAGAIGILLSGPGEDGAAELKLMRERGAVTIAQDAASAVVHGMPGEAIRLGAATHVFSPVQAGAAVAAWLRPRAGAAAEVAGGRQNPA